MPFGFARLIYGSSPPGDCSDDPSLHHSLVDHSTLNPKPHAGSAFGELEGMHCFSAVHGNFRNIGVPQIFRV